jgi:regulator of CtrA degradation
MNDTQATPLNMRAKVVRDFARSDLFDRTFKDGMALVEETASYLDGDGRRDSRLLSREDALIYAGESMRLTTRLMQIASWLLVQRAVREGDMEAFDACDEKYRLSPSLERDQRPDALDQAAIMPEGLLSLLDRSNRLYDRVCHMDKKMFIELDEGAPTTNAVQGQMERLQNAFANGL